MYLPSARWYNWYTLTEQSRGNNGWIEVDAPLDTIPLYVRGGTILAMQEPANNTYLQRNNKIQILAAADGNGTAIGELYWDDGESLDSIWEGHSINPLFVMEPGFLYASIPSYVSKAAEYELHLGRVTVIGLEDRVISVTVNDKEAPFKYDDEIHVLIVDDLDLPFNELVEIRWK